MLTLRGQTKALSYEDVVLVVGGNPHGRPADSSILVFNTTSRVWSFLQTDAPDNVTPPVPAGSVTAQIINDYIWIFGGDEANLRYTNTQIFSVGPLSFMKSGKHLFWSRFDLPAGYNIHNTRSASFVWKNELHIMGGEYNNPAPGTSLPPQTNQTWIYSPSTNKWRDGVRLPVSDHTSFNAVINSSGRIFTFGGWGHNTSWVAYGFTGQVGSKLQIYYPDPMLGISPREFACLVLHKEKLLIYSGNWDRPITEPPTQTFWWDGDSKWTANMTKATNMTIPTWGSVTCTKIKDTLYVLGIPDDATNNASSPVTDSLIAKKRFIFALDLNTLEWFDPMESQYAPSSKSEIGNNGGSSSGSRISLSMGALIGIIIGAIAFIALVLEVILYRMKQSKRNRMKIIPASTYQTSLDMASIEPTNLNGQPQHYTPPNSVVLPAVNPRNSALNRSVTTTKGPVRFLTASTNAQNNRSLDHSDAVIVRK